MAIAQRQENGVEVLEVSGALAADPQGLDLRERVDVQLWVEDPAVVVDLTRCSRIDSGFVGHLLHCHVTLKGRGGRFAIVARGLPLDVLRLARLDELFDVYEDPQAALSAIVLQRAT